MFCFIFFSPHFLHDRASQPASPLVVVYSVAVTQPVVRVETSRGRLLPGRPGLVVRRCCFNGSPDPTAECVITAIRSPSNRVITRDGIVISNRLRIYIYIRIRIYTVVTDSPGYIGRSPSLTAVPSDLETQHESRFQSQLAQLLSR